MIKNYIKIAVKVLLRRKFFTFISLFGISFTLMILVVVTSLADHTFGTQYPEKKLDRTLTSTFWKLQGKNNTAAMGAIISYSTLERYVKTLKTPEDITIFSIYNSAVTYKDNKKFDFAIKYADASFWNVLDFEFLEGRPFTQSDVENINYTAVINEDTRRQYFNNEPAVGKTIEFDGINYRVSGVVKNVSKLRLLVAADIYVPITTTKDDLKNKSLMAGGAGYAAKILARNSSDFAAIKKEFQKHLDMVEFPDDRFTAIKGNADTYLELISRAMFQDYDHANTTGVLLVLFILMVLFMLLPAINLVNINVSRIMERASEIGIRKSFGASSLKLVIQFIIENIILTLIGGFISFIFTIIVLNIINSSGFIPNVELGLNLRIFFVSLFVILFFGLFSGVYPAFKMSRLNPVEALKGGQS